MDNILTYQGKEGRRSVRATNMVDRSIKLCFSLPSLVLTKVLNTQTGKNLRIVRTTTTFEELQLNRNQGEISTGRGEVKRAGKSEPSGEK